MEIDECHLPDAKWLHSFRRRILKWYGKHAREMSWRGVADPYKVWVSEIMLQQTTTAAVEGYYRRFLERFPNVQALATASDCEVLRYWEGLGYYRRATQLHRAAQVIVTEHDATFPSTFEEVLALPGIGRYTSGAICSIAYHQRTPILEANTIRLHARLLAYPDDPAKSAGQKLLWQMAELVLPTVSSKTSPASSPGQMNQALMDLGSLICTPKSPNCANCPVAALCRTAEKGLQHVIPALKTEKNIEERVEAALVIEKRGKFLMMRYPQGVRWAGLWDFPRYELRDEGRGTRGEGRGTRCQSLCVFVPPCETNQAAFEKYCDNIKRLTGYRVAMREQVGEFLHVVTRYKITLKVFRAQTVGRKSFTGENKYQTEWVSKHDLADLALSTTGRKIVEGIIDKK